MAEEGIREVRIGGLLSDACPVRVSPGEENKYVDPIGSENRLTSQNPHPISKLATLIELGSIGRIVRQLSVSRIRLQQLLYAFGIRQYKETEQSECPC
jgi:hypothetical protein